MPQILRKPEILDLARRTGTVTVEGLADHFGVTAQTIRRDLGELAELGELERVHGGAVLPSTTTNIAYEERRAMNRHEKAAIAQACAATIPNDCALFLNIGTTTEAVAAALHAHEGLLIVTNNLNVATILSGNAAIDVILTGGQLRHSDGGLIGDMALSTIKQFRFDYAVIGCSALRDDGDMLDFDIQEVSLSKAIMRQSDQTYLVADRSKFDRKAPARIGSLAQIDGFFTNGAVSDTCADFCKTNQTPIFLSDTAPK